MGGHGERLTQCREVVLTTSKAIPVQVDGEPCKLAASRIRIALRNQATMVQKAKRRSAAPLHSEYVPLLATATLPLSRAEVSPAGQGPPRRCASGRWGGAPGCGAQLRILPECPLAARALASSPCPSSCGSR